MPEPADVVVEARKALEGQIAEIIREQQRVCTHPMDARWPGRAAAAIIAQLLTPDVSADLAGPLWAQYVRWVTPTETHHGPSYHASERRLREYFPPVIATEELLNPSGLDEFHPDTSHNTEDA